MIYNLLVRLSRANDKKWTLLYLVLGWGKHILYLCMFACAYQSVVYVHHIQGSQSQWWPSRLLLDITTTSSETWTIKYLRMLALQCVEREEDCEECSLVCVCTRHQCQSCEVCFT